MPLLDLTQVLKLKLESMTTPDLQSLCLNAGLAKTGSKAEIVGRLLAREIGHKEVDAFMKKSHAAQINDRRAMITDEELRQELSKVRACSGSPMCTWIGA